MEIIIGLTAGLVLFLVLVAVWYFLIIPSKRATLIREAKETAEREAEMIKQKKLLEVKDKFLSKKAELEKEVRQRNQQIQQAENRAKQRELTLNQKQDELTRRKQETESLRQRVETQQALLQKREEELEERAKLRRMYIDNVTGNLKGQLDNTYILRPDGTAVPTADCLLSDMTVEAKLKDMKEKQEEHSVPPKNVEVKTTLYAKAPISAEELEKQLKALLPKKLALEPLPKEDRAIKTPDYSKPDNVNHPKHYCKSGLECIDVIRAAVSNLPPFEAVCVANIIKYAWRYKDKNGLEDVKKAAKYLQLLQEEMKKNG